MDISYIGDTRFYSGITNELRFVSLPLTLAKGQTLLAFITCHDTGLSPSLPSDWTQIMNISGISGSTFVLIYQPTGSTVSPSYLISNLSNKLNCGFIMMFSGCTYHSSKVVNTIESRDNLSNTVGITGLTTTVDNTMIVRFVATFSEVTVSNWTAKPEVLTWIERKDSGITYSSYTIHMASATSSSAPKDDYTDLSYNLSSPTENIAIDIALAPRKTNVLMSMNSF